MPIVKKSISVTDQQDAWVKAQLHSGDYGNESEVFRDLIRKAQQEERENETIRQTLIAGEKSGRSDRTIHEIWEEGRKKALT